MFTPSERHAEQMECEPEGFWPLPINAGNEFAFLLKAPTSIIKAAYRHTHLSLFVATARAPGGLVVATIFAICDDPASPALISGIHRCQEEHLALVESLRLRRTIIVFFDELSRPVARAQCALDPDACERALAILGTPDERYIGPWTPLLASVLDEVDGLIDPTRATPSHYSPAVVNVPIKLSELEVNEILVVGDRESRKFRLDDADEGYGLEQSTWHLVEHLFAGRVFHSPQVQEPAGTRELTDVLAFSEHGACLFETKAAAILTTSLERSTERRASGAQTWVSPFLSLCMSLRSRRFCLRRGAKGALAPRSAWNINSPRIGNLPRSARVQRPDSVAKWRNPSQKQIDKGISQLLGAMRNVSCFLPLLTKAGDPIDMPHSSASPRHGVVLVSELLPSVDWDSIARQLLSASTPPAQLLHVLDLRELRLLVGVSKTPLALITHLSRRFEIMKQCGSALIRTVLDGPPLP